MKSYCLQWTSDSHIGIWRDTGRVLTSVIGLCIRIAKANILKWWSSYLTSVGSTYRLEVVLVRSLIVSLRKVVFPIPWFFPKKNWEIISNISPKSSSLALEILDNQAIMMKMSKYDNVVHLLLTRFVEMFRLPEIFQEHLKVTSLKGNIY